MAGLNRRDLIRASAREGVDVFILDEASLARELGMDHDPRCGEIGGVGAVASFNGMQGDAKNPS